MFNQENIFTSSPQIQVQSTTLFDFSKLTPIYNEFKNFYQEENIQRTKQTQQVSKRFIQEIDPSQNNFQSQSIKFNIIYDQKVFDSFYDQFQIKLQNVNQKQNEKFINLRNRIFKQRQLQKTIRKYKNDNYQEIRKKKYEKLEFEKLSQQTLIKEKISVKKGCNCQQSECRKKYCECFADGKTCQESCKCKNCRNKQKEYIKKEEVKEEIF